jgi:hypothetical protein
MFEGLSKILMQRVMSNRSATAKLGRLRTGCVCLLAGKTWRPRKYAVFMHASYRRHLIGVHLTGVHLFTGVHLL